MYTVWPGQFMMTAMRNTLKKINRTVLEMDLGILFLGVLAQIIGAFIAKDKMMYAGSLWLGVLLALAATYHMYRSLDLALDQPEKTAQKMIFRGYILRYVILIFILLICSAGSSAWRKPDGRNPPKPARKYFRITMCLVSSVPESPLPASPYGLPFF